MLKDALRRRTFPVLLVAGLMALTACKDSTGPGPDPGPDPDPQIPANLRRLVVIDHTSRNVRVVDLAAGSVMETITLGERSQYVFAGASERYAYVVTREANAVSIIDGGVWDETVGGQLHLNLVAPRLHDFRIEGSLPTHSLMNGHLFGTFLDGIGAAKVFDERSLLAGAPTTVEVRTARIHHGIVAPTEGAVILTTPPSRVGGNGIGLDVYGMGGELLASFPDCADPHGAAILDAAAFGCSDKLLLLRRTGGQWSDVRLPYPAEYPGMVITSAIGKQPLPYFAAYIKNLANPAQAAMLRVDATTGAMTPIPVPGRGPSQEYAFDSAGRRLLVIGLDGSLHVYAASTLALEGTVGGATSAQPDPLPGSGVRWATVAAGEGFAYVADPANGSIAEIDLQTRQVTRRIAIGGSPLQIALLGTDRTGHRSVTR